MTRDAFEPRCGEDSAHELGVGGHARADGHARVGVGDAHDARAGAGVCGASARDAGARGAGARGEADSAAVMLEVRDVRFGYADGDEVLAGVTLEVRSGECMCLMGVNGCGKSTLLDCVLGAHRVLSGSIRVQGHDVRQLKPASLARMAAYVPQVHERSFPYEVEHIVLMGRTAHAQGLGAPDEGDAELARDALCACGIEHLAQRPYTSLSGGEMQMVMLARALVQEAPLILMDEPTAHLDFRNELLFLETVQRLVAESHVTVLMATHAPNQAFLLAQAGVPTRVALMHHGRVYREGAPRSVLDVKTLREVFGVHACLLEGFDGEGGRPVRQIAPLHTIGEGER